MISSLVSWYLQPYNYTRKTAGRHPGVRGLGLGGRASFKGKGLAINLCGRMHLLDLSTIGERTVLPAGGSCPVPPEEAFD
jgi:hypothetical protein